MTPRSLSLLGPLCLLDVPLYKVPGLRREQEGRWPLMLPPPPACFPGCSVWIENPPLQKPGSLVSPSNRKVRSAGFQILALLLTSCVSFGKSVYLGLSVLIRKIMMTILPHGVVL